MQNFLNHEIAGTACVLFPSALDERIFLIARLSSILFLIGGESIDLKGRRSASLRLSPQKP